MVASPGVPGRDLWDTHAVHDRPGDTVAVALELGRRRVFASALDWPGWCRPGRDEGSALQALTAYGPRYFQVLTALGLPLPLGGPEALEVVERLEGSATTDFGAPGALADADAVPCTPEEAERLAGCLEATWSALDRAAAAAPPVLRKGPRGGGRDRDAILAHVLAGEAAYAGKAGLGLQAPDPGDREALAAFRAAVAAAVRGAHGGGEAGSPPGRWPLRYLARRAAWHALDHAFEIEDRSEPASSPAAQAAPAR